MLIKALCDYYDVLAKENKVLPDGYTNVKINYLVSLTPDGKIDEIIDCQETELLKTGKEKKTARNTIMPLRTEKSAIDSNVIEHRPLYIFGLDYDNKESKLIISAKSEKSHDAFVKCNLDFLDGLDSPVTNAYRAFLKNWVPESECNNIYLINLKKTYATSNYIFCLSGNTNELLHNDLQVLERWKMVYENSKTNNKGLVLSQCAITGKEEPIARIHNKIKGVSGGNATGTGLVSFNNPSENSYGHDQSYNSNISEAAMKKYTESLNYLLNDKNHKALLDETTVVFWSTDDNEQCTDLMSALIFDNSGSLNAEQTNKVIQQMVLDAREGNVSKERLCGMLSIDPCVDFYMVGIKPNSSRLSIKFMYHKKFGEILTNVASHQKDIQISENTIAIPLWKIKKELISPKSSNESINPALLAKVLESVLYGTSYPNQLLATMVRRIKTDTNTKISPVRAGVVRACINRKSRFLNQEEELKLGLNTENQNAAYLCGRLFAVLEKVQRDALGQDLNRTIKDSYFASATTKPALVFPKLVKLSQNHLNKLNNPTYYQILIQEIIGKLNGEFPDYLNLTEQGKFIIGYYQQYQNFFEKKDKSNNNTQEEE